jgi:hypothetical protein
MMTQVRKLYSPVFLILLVLGTAAVADEKAPVSDKFQSEDVEILISFADASRLNQCSVIGYFPNAKFMYHKALVPENSSVTDRSPAKLFLDWGRSKKAITVSFDRDSARTIWKVPAGALLRMLVAEGVEIPQELLPQMEDKEASNRIVQVDLSSKAATSKSYFIPRMSSQQSGEAVKFDSDAASISLLVQISSPGTLGKRAKDLAPGFSSASKEFKDLTKEERANAWTAGRSCFDEHFHVFGFTMSQSYQGPDTVTEAQDAGGYALTVHRSQNKGVVVIPTLEGKTTGRATGKVFSPVPVEVVQLENQSGNNPKLESFNMKAGRLFEEVLNPILLEKSPGKLECLSVPSQYSSICVKEAGIEWLKVIGTQGRRGNSNHFLLTDDMQTRIWEVTIDLSAENPWKEMEGSFYPIRVSPTAAQFRAPAE